MYTLKSEAMQTNALAIKSGQKLCACKEYLDNILAILMQGVFFSY